MAGNSYFQNVLASFFTQIPLFVARSLQAFYVMSAQKPAQSLQMKIVSYKKYIFLPLSMKHNFWERFQKTKLS